jgi:hypothetical protein
VLLSAKRSRRVDEIGEPLQRVLVLARELDGRCEVLRDAVIERRPDELTLAGEPAVQRPFPHAGVAGNGFDGRIGSDRRVHLAGRAQDAVGIASGVRSQRPIRRRGHQARVTDRLTVTWFMPTVTV